MTTIEQPRDTVGRFATMPRHEADVDLVDDVPRPRHESFFERVGDVVDEVEEFFEDGYHAVKDVLVPPCPYLGDDGPACPYIRPGELGRPCGVSTGGAAHVGAAAGRCPRQDDEEKEEREMIEKILAAAAGMALLAGVAAGCSSSDTNATPAPTDTVTYSAPATPGPIATPSDAPTTAATPAPTVTVPPAGTTVAAADVAAVRAAGGKVYVSYSSTDHSGVTVAQGAPLPPVMVNDVKAAAVTTVPKTFAEFAAADATFQKEVAPALADSGVYVVYVHKVGSWSDGQLVRAYWAVGTIGPNQLDIQQVKSGFNTHAAAVAAAQTQAAKYDAQVIDAG